MINCFPSYFHQSQVSEVFNESVFFLKVLDLFETGINYLSIGSETNNPPPLFKTRTQPLQMHPLSNTHTYTHISRPLTHQRPHLLTFINEERQPHPGTDTEKQLKRN